MQIHFYKYHGTGNDFIMIDTRNTDFPAEPRLVERMCHRRFGIGADGLILIANHRDYDFSMRYFNSDGYEGSMCGNGGRCTVRFAHDLGIIGLKTVFTAVDGEHSAEILGDKISLKMADVDGISHKSTYWFVDTGSPHVVIPHQHIDALDVFGEGQKVRYNKEIFPEGTNVNFIEAIDQNQIKIRTYERGVEDETWSCGTGSVASSLIFASMNNFKDGPNKVILKAPGGELNVQFDKKNQQFSNIHLIGPATKVFEGDYQL